MNPAQLVTRAAAVVAAAAIAMPVISEYEGKRNTGYTDPAPGKYETICWGHLQPGVLGKTYTDQQCVELLAADAVKHGLDIAPCLPDVLPVETRAAFISFGFNVGAKQFCASSLSKKAMGMDLAGACAELSRWTYAGPKQLPGLVKRRAAERKLCEAGLV